MTDDIDDDAAVAWKLDALSLQISCGTIAACMKECMEITDKLKRTRPSFLSRIIGIGKAHGSHEMLLRSKHLADYALKILLEMEGEVARTARIYGQSYPSQISTLYKTAGKFTLAIVALHAYLSRTPQRLLTNRMKVLSWTEYEDRYTTGVLTYLQFVRPEGFPDLPPLDVAKFLRGDYS